MEKVIEEEGFLKGIAIENISFRKNPFRNSFRAFALRFFDENPLCLCAFKLRFERQGGVVERLLL
ncbi:hypothetical protein AT239_04050 [Bartonella henselae]|nr:hypothetical protein AT239_04050 [Bartonella henselae]OLL53430.1 hypothetical protein AT240_03080 [Bartonella henselae]